MDPFPGDDRPWTGVEGEVLAWLPAGSWEQHGPSLPLYTDTLIAYAVARRARERIGGLLLPPLAYGASHEHIDFPGTVSLEPDTLYKVLWDIASSVERHGVRLMVIVNGHGGNRALMEAFAQRWNYRGSMRVLHVFPYTGIDTRGEIHAGVIESSIVKALGAPSGPGEGRACTGVYRLLRTVECSETGSIYPGEYEPDEELGKRILEEMTGYTIALTLEAAKVLGIELEYRSR